MSLITKETLRKSLEIGLKMGELDKGGLADKLVDGGVDSHGCS